MKSSDCRVSLPIAWRFRHRWAFMDWGWYRIPIPRYSQSLTILDMKRKNSQVHKFCCYESWIHPTHGRSSQSWGSLEPHNNPLLPVKTWNNHWLKIIKIHINYNITLLNDYNICASIYSWQFKPKIRQVLKVPIIWSKRALICNVQAMASFNKEHH